MLILTESGEAINAYHIVRFFLQTDADERIDQGASRSRLILQLTNRQKVVVADLFSEAGARAVFSYVVRQWIRGQRCTEITAALKRIEKGEPSGTGREEACL